MTDKKLIKEVLKALVEQGWRVEEGTKHHMAYSPDKTVSPVTVPATPSDRRGFENLVHQLRRGGFVWPWNAQAKKQFRQIKRRED
jgi:hypothetical protein